MTPLFAMLLLLTQDAPKLTLTTSVDKAEATLGGAVQIEARLKNDGTAPAVLPALCFDERSLSFSVTIDVAGGAPLTFDATALQGSPLLAKRLALPTVTLAPGKEMVGYFSVPAISVGKMIVKARVATGETNVEDAAGVTVTVTPLDGKGRLVAVVETTWGEAAGESARLSIRLKPEGAPRSVANFVSLVQRRFYDGMVFHHVVKNRWMATGCPFGKGIGGPGYSVRAELPGEKDPKTKVDAGTVALGAFEADGAQGYTGSQFFIALGRLPKFDGQYTVIGNIQTVIAPGENPLPEQTGDKAPAWEALTAAGTLYGTEGKELKPAREIRIAKITLASE